MKPIVTFLAAVAMTLLPSMASGQLTAAGAFSSAPQNLFPLLDTNTRLDMIDYYNAGMPTESTNNLDGKSRILSMDQTMLTAKLTDASSISLFLLPAASDTIVGVITTVAMPGKDSSMTLYTREWKKTAQQFVAPGLADWMTDRSRSAEVEMIVPFMLVSYSFDPATSILTLTNSLGDFLSDDSYRTVASLVKPRLEYVWDGRKFKPVGK